MNYTTSTATEQVVLSAQEKAQLAHRARRDLLRVLFSQVLAAVVVAVVFLLVSGARSGVSALLGAACYLAPNAVFVLRLLLATFKPQGAGAGTFLVGNMLKILVAVGLLWLLADHEAGRLDWLAAVVGLIAALKGYWFGLLLTGGKLGK
jgi:ATP synthase protein I